MSAARELTHTFLIPTPAAPLATIANQQLAALKQLTIIFQTAAHSAQPQFLLDQAEKPHTFTKGDQDFT
jgi:hypothetical protein